MSCMVWSTLQCRRSQPQTRLQLKIKIYGIYIVATKKRGRWNGKKCAILSLLCVHAIHTLGVHYQFSSKGHPFLFHPNRSLIFFFFRFGLACAEPCFGDQVDRCFQSVTWMCELVTFFLITIGENCYKVTFWLQCYLVFVLFIIRGVVIFEWLSP